MTSQQFCVRVGDPADLPLVVVLERKTAEAPHWAESEYAAILTPEAEIDGSVRRRLFVAEGGGRLLGFAVGKLFDSGDDGTAELENVVVEESMRRHGVGKALCGAVHAWCRTQGMTILELEVRAGRAGAIALYTGLGFVIVGRRRRYYREPVDDALLMRLDLAKYK